MRVRALANAAAQLLGEALVALRLPAVSIRTNLRQAWAEYRRELGDPGPRTRAH
jgi:hypothetical protein